MYLYNGVGIRQQNKHFTLHVSCSAQPTGFTASWPFMLNSGRPYAHVVRRNELNHSLLELLATKYAHTSRDVWVEHLASGRVAIDGSIITDCSTKLQEGMKIVYSRPPWVEPPCDMAGLKSLHDDGALVVLHKPSGLPVLPSELYYENTVLSALQRMRRQSDDNSEVPHPAHRLGVGTSGLLLCAVGGRNRAALSRGFEERTIQKTYRALAAGIIPWSGGAISSSSSSSGAATTAAVASGKNTHDADTGTQGLADVSTSSRARKKREREDEREEGEQSTLRRDHGGDAEAEADADEAAGHEPAFEIACPIGPVPHCSWSGSVHGAMPEGGTGAKHALSIVRVLQRDAARDCTLVEVRIPTGRPHQIRIHMAYLGHPLVGDPLYVSGGRPKTPPEEQQQEEDAEGSERPPLPRDVGYLLHAHIATLTHPVSGERLTFRAPPPSELCTDGELATS